MCDRWGICWRCETASWSMPLKYQGVAVWPLCRIQSMDLESASSQTRFQPCLAIILAAIKSPHDSVVIAGKLPKDTAIACRRLPSEFLAITLTPDATGFPLDAPSIFDIDFNPIWLWPRLSKSYDSRVESYDSIHFFTKSIQLVCENRFCRKSEKSKLVLRFLTKVKKISWLLLKIFTLPFLNSGILIHSWNEFNRTTRLTNKLLIHFNFLYKD